MQNSKLSCSTQINPRFQSSVFGLCFWSEPDSAFPTLPKPDPAFPTIPDTDHAFPTIPDPDPAFPTLPDLDYAFPTIPDPDSGPCLPDPDPAFPIIPDPDSAFPIILDPDPAPKIRQREKLQNITLQVLDRASSFLKALLSNCMETIHGDVASNFQMCRYFWIIFTCRYFCNFFVHIQIRYTQWLADILFLVLNFSFIQNVCNRQILYLKCA
jgi:hypothetical protein